MKPFEQYSTSFNKQFGLQNVTSHQSTDFNSFLKYFHICCVHFSLKKLLKTAEQTGRKLSMETTKIVLRKFNSMKFIL